MPKHTHTRCPKNVQTVENKFTKMQKSVGDEPLPVDLFEAAKEAMQDLLPKKSVTTNQRMKSFWRGRK